MRIALIAGLMITAMTLMSEANAAVTCESLMALKLPDTTLTKAETVAAGDFEVPSLFPGVPTPTFKLPAHCKITGSIRPTSDSDIQFEVWLPTSSWNHRYQQTGNGGLAGKIMYNMMIDSLRRGSATAATNDGHVSTTGFFDASWAPGHPEKMIDYGSRAVHLTALTAQALVRAYYSQKAAHTYFLGCSDGGRESLMEAQRYPQDFEGYLVGAPGIDHPGNFIRNLFDVRTLQALGPNQQLTIAQLKGLADKSLERCDSRDGIKDGVLRDPRRCDFKAQEIVCHGAPDTICLTPTQAAAVQRIYDGLKDPTTGLQLQPGDFGTMGTENVTWPGIIDTHLGSALSLDNNAVLGTLLYDDPKITVDLVKASGDTKTRINPVMNADSPDLRIAQRTGRKILQWHGWADPNISASYSLAYFEAVQKFLGNDSQNFYRLFMAPGMGHCKGGVGPTILGGVFQGPTNVAGVADTSGAPGDPKHDVVTALEQWVEHGSAPDTLVVSDYQTTGPVIPAGTPVKSTRPLCPYPREATYRGSGSADEAANFTCELPKP